ncbi:MAG: hypothetical protein WEB02_11700 [Methylophaga sp.]
MTNLFILLIRAVSLLALFILTLLLITREIALRCKRWLAQPRKIPTSKHQPDPLASLKKAGLSI